MIGAAQTGRPGADDGHGLIFLGHFRDRQGIPVGLVRREPLQVADGHGLVHFLAAAVAFARVRADAADGPGQGQAIHDELQGFVIFAGLDELDIALDAQIGGAGPDAGGPVELLDGKGGGHRLGKMAIGRVALPHALVKRGRQQHRADLGAGPAGVAFGRVDIAGLAASG